MLKMIWISREFPKMTEPIPEITVAMPVFNAEVFLAESLECIISQNFKNFEVIVSDNCSSDSTIDIVKEFAAKDHRIRLITQTKNIGAMANYGALLDCAKGKYFLWRSYDDLSDKNYLQELHGLISSNPECALAVPKVVRIFPDKSVSSSKEYPDIEFVDKIDLVKKLLKSSQTGWMYGLFRLPEIREAYRKAVDGFEHTWAQDNLILLPFLLQGQVRGTNNTTFYQRETGIGDSKYRPKTLVDRWELVRDFYFFSRNCLSQSNLSSEEKRKLFFPIVRYTNDRSEKFKKVIRPFFIWLLLRPFEKLSGKKTGWY